jgi:hypothetical protein
VPKGFYTNYNNTNPTDITIIKNKPMKNLFFAFLGAAIFLTASCSKNNAPAPVRVTSTAVVISSLSPASGGYDTVVTITGRNFSPTATNNIVKFNGMLAVVQSATATEIKAIVPVGAGSGAISVATTAAAAVTGPSFAYHPVVTNYFAGADGVDPVYWKNGIEHSLPTVQPISYVFTMAAISNDIYIAGYNGTNFVNWKNGVATSTPVHGSAIAASGADVYIAGDNGENGAVYTKNGTEYTLPLTGHTGYIQAMAISGTDVYFAGIDLSAKDSPSAVYWKNGKEYILPTSTNPSYANLNAMAISGTDIYFAGQDGQAAVYWKNGKEYPLSTKSEVAMVTTMAIAGNDIYFGGVDFRSAVYWKNGTEVILPLQSGGSNHSNVTAMAISGTDVYITGGESYVKNANPNDNFSITEYWKNGISHTLPVVNTGKGSVSGLAIVSK